VRESDQGTGPNPAVRSLRFCLEVMRMKPQRAAAPDAQHGSSSPASASFERLVAENEELRQQIKRLGVQQTHFSHRIQRVEDSQLFRFLRWLGGRLQDLPSWVRRVIPLHRLVGAGTGLSYEDWVEQSAMIDLACDPPETAPESSDLVSVLVWKKATRGSLVDNERALASISAQTHTSRETYFCAEDSSADFRQALDKCKGTFVAIVSSDAVLEPRAIERWLRAAQPDVDLVYSDWDYIDGQSHRHTPRFTPEYSPILLEQTLYWGECFLVRAEVLRRVAASDFAEDRDLLHRLAIEASRSGNVARIPRVLWHQSGEVKNQFVPLPTVEVSYTASIIICSRSPERLRRCLTSLHPTIDARTEIVVVNHETDRPNGLAEIATSLGAKVVPYRGAFHFGLMNELGARAANGSILVFLNDDVFPIATDWLNRMAQHVLKPDVGVVGAVLHYPSGQIQHAGVVVGCMRGATHIGRHMNEALLWPWLTVSREVTAVTGACMAIRRDVWDELQGFDRRFPVNYNDVDLCLRAEQAGYRVILEAGAALTHEESQTRPPGTRPEEVALFASIWSDVMDRPDPFFHPDLTSLGRNIPLRSPWARLGEAAKRSRL
jgi:GT2 family glycosyltransferase